MSADPIFTEGWRCDWRRFGQHKLYWRERGPSDAPACVLLHGFPQTGAMWKPVVDVWDADGFGETRRLVVVDAPGYGRSRAEPGVEAASKRVWSESLAGLLDHLGAGQAEILGHDRGGRWAYRFALEHKARVAKLAVLDILPTCAYWTGVAQRDFALRIYHWMFLAQPAPLPETLIGAAPDFYIEDKLSRWSRDGDLRAFAPAALEAYKANAKDPAALSAMCDDYRAGASVDVELDLADQAAGRKIAAPSLALWGAAGLANKSATPLSVWSEWCQEVDGFGVDSGHFLPEEAPKETADRLSNFLRRS